MEGEGRNWSSGDSGGVGLYDGVGEDEDKEGVSYEVEGVAGELGVAFGWLVVG